MSEDYIPKDKSDLLEVIRLEREKLVSLFEGLNETQMAEPGVEVAWSIKDILAHIAAWERVAIDIIQPARDGQPLKPYVPKVFESIDNFNAVVFDSHKNKDLTEIIGEFEASHRDFMDLIETLTEAFVFTNLPFEGTEELSVQNMISSNTHWHYLEHAESIRKWLAS
jgi:hypothetical protein